MECGVALVQRSRKRRARPGRGYTHERGSKLRDSLVVGTLPYGKRVGPTLGRRLLVWAAEKLLIPGKDHLRVEGDFGAEKSRGHGVGKLKAGFALSSDGPRTTRAAKNWMQAMRAGPSNTGLSDMDRVHESVMGAPGAGEMSMSLGELILAARPGERALRVVPIEAPRELACRGDGRDGWCCCLDGSVVKN